MEVCLERRAPAAQDGSLRERDSGGKSKLGNCERASERVSWKGERERTDRGKMGLCLLLFPTLTFFLSSQPTRRPCSLCLPPFLSYSFFSGLHSPHPLPTTPPDELQMMTAIRKDVTSRASPVPKPFSKIFGGTFVDRKRDSVRRKRRRCQQRR